MSWDMVGQTCALSAALSWALALVLFKKSGEQVTPLALNLFKNTIGIVLLGLTLLALGEGPPLLREHEIEDIYILVFSGIIGIALADTLMFWSLNLIGVGLLAIVDCAYSPMIIFVAWLLISGEVTLAHYIGGGLVVSAVFLSSQHEPPRNRTRAQLLGGIVLAILALASMALGIVLAKPLLEYFPLIWATFFRLLVGSLVLALLALSSRQRGVIWAVFRPAAVWRFSIPGAILGGYLSMILWLAGFKYTSASVAAILNQTSTIFALLLATLVLKEAMTGRKMLAVTLAVVGVIAVTAF
jgi:drug/metabolite transporter (DMT)-like permease